MQLIKNTVFIALSFFLVSCSALIPQNNGNNVIETSALKISKCKFLGNVDSIARITTQSARFDLKNKAQALGATHIVETLIYTAQLGISSEYGPAISARAYICPKGEGGDKTTQDALLPYEYEVLQFHESEFF